MIWGQKKETRIHEALAISSTVLFITNRLGSVKHSPHLFNLVTLYPYLYNLPTEKSLYLMESIIFRVESDTLKRKSNENIDRN